MVHYRLYFLSAYGRILRADDIEVADDEVAKEAALAFDHAHRIEIWSGSRKVDTVLPKAVGASSDRA